MVFHRQLAVGFFNFIIAGAAGHAQRFVKVFVAHRNLLVWNLLDCSRKYGRTRETQGAEDICRQPFIECWRADIQTCASFIQRYAEK